ncbi:hypothetical protein LCGC14_1474670 [marine sediment metagenome]|uniref:Uncharacterized protein n=1 Tax=marine sediment metagenome TaxID=412755 RepID=A0A0F9JX82_9ZZZZ
MSIRECLDCRTHQEELSKEKIVKEIQAFLKNPEKYHVKYNTTTGFYKFELIK